MFCNTQLRQRANTRLDITVPFSTCHPQDSPCWSPTPHPRGSSLGRKNHQSQTGKGWAGEEASERAGKEKGTGSICRREVSSHGPLWAAGTLPRDRFQSKRVTFQDVHLVRGQPPVYHCGFDELIHCPHLHPHPHLLLRRCLTGGLSAQMSSLLHTSTDPPDHCGSLSALACTLHLAKQEPRPRGPPESWGLEQIRVQWRLSCLLKPRGRCSSLRIRF